MVGKNCNVGFAVKEGWTIMWLPEVSLSVEGLQKGINTISIEF